MRRIALNTVVQVAGKIFSATLGVIITILLTRYLGPAGYGQYTLVFVFVALFGSVADWGLSFITIREASQKEEKAAAIVGNVLVVRLLLSVIAVAFCWIASVWAPYSGQIKIYIFIASLYLIIASLKTSFQMIFNIKLKMENWAISEIMANITILVGVLFVVAYRGDMALLFWVFNFGHIAAAGMAAYLGYRLLPLKYSLFTDSTKYLLTETIPMGSIMVLFTIYNRVDTVILSYFKGDQAVGYYAAAYRIYEVLILMAAYFANSVLPMISKLAVNDHNLLAKTYRRCFAILIVMGLVVALINFFLAPLGILVVGGERFAPAVGPLKILSLALIVSYINHINGYTLIALKKQWASLKIAAVALTLNLGLNLVFVPRYSFLAAAFITFLTEAFIVIASVLVINREIGLWGKRREISY